jgi:capsular exopolysaccharide synthesis family protein
MSKIEKALNQARRDARMALVPTSPKVPENSRGERQPARAGTGKSTDMSPRAAASAEIARMQEPSLRNRNELAMRGIIFPNLSENQTVQAFRDIRTRILQRTQGRNAIIMVTSVARDSGNSFVALNLGVAFAFDAGRTALLLDCNLRNSSTQQLFSGECPAGITDYLENPDIDVKDIIHPIGIERLRVIPVGSRQDVPTEYFTSQKARQLLDGIRDRYAERFVIVDAPPMTESADTQILAELCDYVLLVAPYGRVTHMQIDSCIDAIDPNKFLGVVFNNEPRPIHLDAGKILRDAGTSIRALLAMAGQRLARLTRAHRHERFKK